MKALVIGAGGVGSWLTPALCLLIGKENVTVMDGDTLEEGNLNRQLFTFDDIGKNKAAALAERYLCEYSEEWYHFGLLEHDRNTVLMVCVDNNPARMEALKACDYEGCRAIFAANERTSAEAYVYLPAWRSTNLDPRVMYPEMLADRSGDPRARGIGCTGAAQLETPQLVTANLMAGALALHLFVAWELESVKLNKEAIPHLPHKLVQNLSKSESFKAQVQWKKGES